jgi:molybdopterin-guanine dinucleotide biosynthesis protein A
MVKWASLVLAGGKASRFQNQNQPWMDKALAHVNGKPLLVNVVLNLQQATDEVVVSVNDQQRQNVYYQILKEYGINVRFAIDQDSQVQGPLLAIASGLNAVQAEACLVVPTDMPFLKPQVARHILESAADVDVAVPMWPDGTLETLLMAVKKESTMETAQTLLTAGKAQAAGLVRGAGKLKLLSPMQKIKLLDPELESFVNINYAKDLVSLQTRSTTGDIRQDMEIDLGEVDVSALELFRKGLRSLHEGAVLEAQGLFRHCERVFEDGSLFFWAALSSEKLGQSMTNCREGYVRAADTYRAEAEIWAERCRLLFERALSDAAWCERQAALE